VAAKEAAVAVVEGKDISAKAARAALHVSKETDITVNPPPRSPTRLRHAGVGVAGIEPTTIKERAALALAEVLDLRRTTEGSTNPDAEDAVMAHAEVIVDVAMAHVEITAEDVVMGHKEIFAEDAAKGHMEITAVDVVEAAEVVKVVKGIVIISVKPVDMKVVVEVDEVDLDEEVVDSVVVVEVIAVVDKSPKPKTAVCALWVLMWMMPIKIDE